MNRFPSLRPCSPDARCLPAALLLAFAGGCAGPAHAPELVRSSAPHALGSGSTAPRPGRVQAGAAGDAERLAKDLANPISDLMNVPLQLDYDEDIGVDDDGSRWQLNVKPVIPFSISDEWNMISRTIVPLIDQDDVVPSHEESGLGDTTQSLFFSPKQPTETGWIWGAGPVFLLPTATHDNLGRDRLGFGPTAVFVKEEGPWTYGGLWNHIWSIAGDGDDGAVNQTFLQPFVAHTTPTAWTYSANLETTYDWREEDWAVPLNLVATKVVQLGDLPVSIGGGLRYWLEHADGGPEGLGLRLVMTFLFPK